MLEATKVRVVDTENGGWGGGKDDHDYGRDGGKKMRKTMMMTNGRGRRKREKENDDVHRNNRD